MSSDRVSAVLPSTDRDDVLQAIHTIRTKLPFLIDLSPNERHSLPKIGTQGVAFVNTALEVATQNPDILPGLFDLAEMRKDVELLQAMQSIQLALGQVFELVNDTTLAVGSDAYAAGLTVYQFAKQMGKGSALDGVLDELGKRFARKMKPAPKPTVPAQK